MMMMTGRPLAVLLVALTALVLAVSSNPLQGHSDRDHMVEQFKKRLAAQSSTGQSSWHWLTCDSCKLVTGVIQFAVEMGMGEKEMEDLIIRFCDWLHIYDKRVCVGLVQMYKDEVLYLIEHLVLRPDEICGVLMGPDCGPSYWPLSPWNVTLPNVPKPPVKPHVLPKNGSRSVKVLHLTDIHLDMLYAPGTNAKCDEPLCCRIEDGPPKPGTKGAGMFGDYRACDTPQWTLDDLFSHLATHHHFDYILWTGDLPAHNVWAQSRADQTGMLHYLKDLMLKYFPLTAIFPSVGNHESSPANSFPPRYIKGDQSISWLYNALADSWDMWLTPEALATVRKGGYYTVVPFPGYRIISLNTNVCYEWNWWLFLNTTDPDGQLAWLVDTLQEAENKHEKVHILGHIPPGIGNCLKYWSANYYRIVDRYESTITGQFFGHTHFDHFEVFYDLETLKRPTNVAYITPSVTPYSHLNMGFRIFTMEAPYKNSSWAVLDHETYILNLTSANTMNRQPVWELEYKAKDALGMASLFPQDWDQLIQRAHKDNDLLQTLYRFYYKSHTPGPCDSGCGQLLLCAMRSAKSYSSHLFCPDIPPSTFTKHPLFKELC